MATSTSTAPATILTACAVRDGNLAARPPTTCSTQCPSHTVTVSVAALVTVGVVPEHCCFDLEPAAVASTPTSTLDISGVRSTGANSLMHETDFSSVTSSSCSTICLGGHTSSTSTPSSQAAALASSTYTPVVPVSASPTSGMVDEISWCGSTSDISAAHAIEPTLVSPVTCLTWCSDDALASTKSNNTDDGTAQPVIFNSESVDPAIVTVPRGMTLTAASTVAGLLDNSLVNDFASLNGSNNFLETVSCIFRKLFTWYRQFHWPTVSLYGSSLISSDTQKEFMERYSVITVVTRSLILAVMSDETVHRTFIQSALTNTILLLPWDPGLPLSGIGTKLSTFVHELAVRLTVTSEVTCLQGSSIREQRSYNVVLETILNGRVAFVELQPWPSWEKTLLVFPVVRATFDKFHNLAFPVRMRAEGAIRLLHNILLQDWFHAFLIGHNIRCTFELLQWKIAWSVHWECYEIASTDFKEFVCSKACEENLQANFVIVYEICTDLCICVVIMWAVLQAQHVRELSILVVHCHFAEVQFQWKFAMQRCTSSSGFLVILNGTTEVQRHPSSHRVVPVKVFSVFSTKFIDWEDGLRPLPWSSFMCCHGGRRSWLPRYSVLCKVGTATLSEGWSLDIEINPWPAPPSIHGSVPTRGQNAWFHSWLELLHFENDCSLTAWVGCHTTGTCLMSKHMELTVGRDTSYGVNTLDFRFSALVHGCELISGFHHEKLWDPGGSYSCDWNCHWWMVVVLVNCKNRLGEVHSTEQWSPLQALEIESTNKCLLYEKSILTRGLFSTHPRNYVLMLESRLPIWMQLMLSRRAQMHEKYNSGFELVDYHGYPAWTLACISSWRLQSSSNHAIVLRNRTSCGVEGLDHAYYFDKVCADQDYCIDVFSDQVHIGHDYYLNLVQVCLDYDTHCDIGEFMKNYMPWDPGGLTRHRLEVKPNVKEGGMLAANPTLTWATGLGLLYLAYWTWAAQEGSTTNTREWLRTKLGLELDGFGLHCFCLLQSFFLLFPL